MTSINRISPSGLAALLTSIKSTPSVVSAGDFEGSTLKAMILDNTNDLGAGTNWDNMVDLVSYGGTLGEFLSVGPIYWRKAVTVSSTSFQVGSAALSIQNPVWAALPGGVAPPSHILFYIEKAGAATDSSSTPPPLTDRIPLLVVDAVFSPDGTDFTAVQPIGGIIRITA